MRRPPHTTTCPWCRQRLHGALATTAPATCRSRGARPARPRLTARKAAAHACCCPVPEQRAAGRWDDFFGNCTVLLNRTCRVDIMVRAACRAPSHVSACRDSRRARCSWGMHAELRSGKQAAHYYSPCNVSAFQQCGPWRPPCWHCLLVLGATGCLESDTPLPGDTQHCHVAGTLTRSQQGTTGRS